MTNTLLTVLSAERLAEHTKSGAWRHETIYALLKAHAARAPDRTAIRDRGRRLTYRQLMKDVDNLTADLSHRGVRPGQRVSLWMPSRIESAIVLLSCSRNGYVCVPSLHRDHTVAEI